MRDDPAAVDYEGPESFSMTHVVVHCPILHQTNFVHGEAILRPMKPDSLPQSCSSIERPDRRMRNPRAGQDGSASQRELRGLLRGRCHLLRDTFGLPQPKPPFALLAPFVKRHSPQSEQGHYRRSDSLVQVVELVTTPCPQRALLNENAVQMTQSDAGGGQAGCG